MSRRSKAYFESFKKYDDLSDDDKRRKYEKKSNMKNEDNDLKHDQVYYKSKQRINRYLS